MPGPGPLLVSVSVALGCAVLMAQPALAGGRRTYVEEQGARGRGGRHGLLQRAGGDLALLVVAALAIWQLRRYGAPVTATTGGGLGVDPLIVAGPALALLCGGMLGLRLVPRLSRLAERFTAGRAALAPALGTWQVSRRPLRYAGPALLLTMAVGIGGLSLTTTATWRASQDDQARHQAGADLRVAGAVAAPELGPLGRGGVYAALPGVTAISPAVRATATFGDDDAVLLALDAAQLGRLMPLRPDLSAVPVGTLARRLTATRPAAPTAIPLPGRPGTLTVTARLHVSAHAGDYTGLTLRLVLADALGAPWQVALGPLTPDGAAHDLTADLTALAGRSGRPAYPLAVRGALLDVPAPAEGGALTLTVERMTAGGAEARLPAGATWTASVRGKGAIGGVSTGGDGLLTLRVPAPAPPEPAAKPRDDEHVAVRLGPAAGPLPVVVTAGLADAKRLATGATGTMTVDGRPTPITVAGVVDALPGTAAGRAAVLTDLPGLLARDLADARPAHTASEWWMTVRDGDTSPAAAVLARHPEWDQTVVDRAGLAERLRGDPLAAGLQGALMLAFAAALVFALLGFLVNAAVSARERAAEFALLRALGAGYRQVFGLLVVEQAFIGGLPLVIGTALAIGLAAVVVPHIVLTGQAAAVTPAVLLVVPWPALLAMAVLIAAVLVAIVALLARRPLRASTGLGEDR